MLCNGLHPWWMPSQLCTFNINQVHLCDFYFFKTSPEGWELHRIVSHRFRQAGGLRVHKHLMGRETHCHRGYIFRGQGESNSLQTFHTICWLSMGHPLLTGSSKVDKNPCKRPVGAAGKAEGGGRRHRVLVQISQQHRRIIVEKNFGGHLPAWAFPKVD